MSPRDYAIAALDDAHRYADDVISGEIITGRYTRLAVERFLRDLKDGADRGLRFDEDAAIKALGIFSYLRHSKGQQWVGKQVELGPWQSFVIANVFGWINEATGLRRFKYVYEEVARKNGKTTKLAGIGLKGLMKDDQGSPEVYSAATKRDQAKLLFDEARRMIQQSPALRRRIRIVQNKLSYNRNGGLFVPLSSDASTQDGLNPSLSLIDELHAHRTSEVWDVIVSAVGARLEPIVWAITTAGFNQSGVCYEKRSYSVSVLEGSPDFDDSWFAVIYTIDDNDDPFDESCWIKANPNLGVSVDLGYLREQAKQARLMPSAMTNFLTKNLNRWVSAEVLWCATDAWTRAGEDYTYEEFVDWVRDNNATVYGGLDLASTRDLAALGLLAVSDDGLSWRVWVNSYLPEETAKEKIQKSPVPYMRWADDGWLTLTPGITCDYRWIMSDIVRYCDELPIDCIHYDRWN